MWVFLLNSRKKFNCKIINCNETNFVIKKNCAGWRRTGQDWCGWYWQLCVCQSCPWKNSIQKLCSKIQWNKAKLLFNNWKKCCMLLPHRWLQWIKYFATFSTYVAVCRPLSYNLDLDIDLGQKWWLTSYQIRPSI